MPNFNTEKVLGGAVARTTGVPVVPAAGVRYVRGGAAAAAPARPAMVRRPILALRPVVLGFVGLAMLLCASWIAGQ